MMGILDDKAVISGIGQSDVGRPLARSGVSLTVQACLAAIADAGLTPEDIDGVATFPGADNSDPGYAGASAGEIIDALGFRVNWYKGEAETSGQMGPVMSAAMAVATGVARHVVCFRTVTEASAQGGKGRRAVLSGETKARHWSEWCFPFGARPPNLMALYAQRYMHDYGLTREHLGMIAINNRRNAGLNPKAVFREPLTMDQYLNARMISEPLCLFDCDVPVDASTAVIVSATSLSKKLRRPGLIIESFGCAVDSRLSFGQGRLDETAVADSAAMMWKRTDLRPSDVGVAQLYDGFSFLTIAWLDALGFCERGQAGTFLNGGERIALEGELPITTYGGQLSAGRLHGFGVLHEACVQLWGEGGPRQVPRRPRVAVAAAGGGIFAGCLLLKRSD
jgi:acetyl-CoA acetyltransferase